MRRGAFAIPGSSAAIPKSSASLLASVPEVATGELEKHVFEARLAVQVGKIFFARQGLQDGRSVVGIHKYRIAGALDAWGQRACALHPCLVTGAVHFDDLRFDMLGDQRAR